jgi:HEAT repeat protein
MDHWRSAAVLPLLLELVRALRARRFFLPEDPNQAVVLQRSASIWAGAFSRGASLRLAVAADAFRISRDQELGGAGVRELARSLGELGIRELCVLPGLAPRELIQFVEILARAVDSAAPVRPLAPALAQAGIVHLALVEAQPAPAAQPVAAAPATPALPPTRAVAPPPPEVERAAEISPIEGLLADLDRCARPSDYERIARDLDAALRGRMEEKDYVDAYRAALVFGRHCAGVGSKLPEVQARATEALHRLLLGSEELLRIAVQRAYAPGSGSAVEAVQLLVALGGEIVPRLLEEHTRGSSEAQERTPQILVAMADQALPVLMDELQADSPARVRRAARLLGDMQHPRAESLLAALLIHPDEGTRREAGRALGRIGSQRAIGRLSEALRGAPDTAQAAAYGLGWCSGSAAVRALATALLDDGKGREELRREAALALGRNGHSDGFAPLERVLRKGSLFGKRRLHPLKLAAVEALGRLGGERAQALLRELSTSGDASLRDPCMKALEVLQAGSGTSAPPTAEASEPPGN